MRDIRIKYTKMLRGLKGGGTEKRLKAGWSNYNIEIIQGKIYIPYVYKFSIAFRVCWTLMREIFHQYYFKKIDTFGLNSYLKLYYIVLTYN